MLTFASSCFSSKRRAWFKTGYSPRVDGYDYEAPEVVNREDPLSDRAGAVMGQRADEEGAQPGLGFGRCRMSCLHQTRLHRAAGAAGEASKR